MVLLFALTAVLILRVLPICGGDGNGSFGFLFAVFTFVTTQIALALALAQTHYAAIVCRNKCHKSSMKLRLHNFRRVHIFRRLINSNSHSA
jgi:hypothetical protein